MYVKNVFFNYDTMDKQDIEIKTREFKEWYIPTYVQEDSIDEKTVKTLFKVLKSPYNIMAELSYNLSDDQWNVIIYREEDLELGKEIAKDFYEEINILNKLKRRLAYLGIEP